MDEIYKDCIQCKLGIGIGAGFYCGGAEYKDIHPQDLPKPDWCPLKEVPERKDTISQINLAKEAEINHVKVESQAGFNLRWNACIDAMLKTEG